MPVPQRTPLRFRKRLSDLVGQGLQAFLYQTRDFALTRGWHAFGDSRYADSQIGVAFCVAQRAAHAQRAAYRIVAYNRIASGSRILNQLPHFTGAHAAVLFRSEEHTLNSSH